MSRAVAQGWQLTGDEGPDWLFLQLHQNLEEYAPEPSVAAAAWKMAEDCKKLRIVLELAENVRFTSYLVGQLILLHKRAEISGGTLRICNFPAVAYEALRTTRVSGRFPNYSSREDAVVGRLPATT